MIPKLALEKAREGGWNPGRSYTESHWALVAMKAGFWQGLAKAIGHHANETKDFFGCDLARCFYDLVLFEKSTSDYWKELLTK